MSEISMYEAQKKKMKGLCEEHDLTYRFRKDTYPITFTIRPVQGLDAQISMLEKEEEVGYRSPDASMTWIFVDGDFDTKVRGGTFTISKTLRAKIENILIKMISFWQQFFFRDVIEHDALRRGRMPVIDEDEAEDFPEDEDEAPEDEEPMEVKVTLAKIKPPEELEFEFVMDDLDDSSIQQAMAIVRTENKATAALLQRRMNIGPAKAARLIDALENMGIIGPDNGDEPREVLAADEPDDL